MKIIIRYIFYFSLFFIFNSCHFIKSKEIRHFQEAKKVLLTWNQIVLELERHTSGFRPPVSSRMFAYTGICAFETSLPSLENYNSLKSSILPNTIQIPTAPEKFHLAIALNAAYAQFFKYIFASAPALQLDILEKKEISILQELEKGVDNQSKEQSIQFGKTMAKAIWEFSKTDNIGHQGELFNYDKSYIPPNCKGCWLPCGEIPMPALLPNWGKVRTFLVHNEDIEIRKPLEFNETRNSSFYTEAMEVFLIAQNRTPEEIWIAEFWSDDLPGLTITPPGRWISISNQLFYENEMPFPKVLETYLKLGLALNDASVICWNAKYKYNVERPESYIHRNISPNWKSLHDSPSFPSYPSGHSLFGAASVEILKTTLDNNRKITDQTHKERPEFKGKPRTYNSLDEMAKENAFSRLSMGVHYRMDCEEGYRIGLVIGKKIAQFNLKK